MTTRRRNHVFSLLFTILVAGAVYLVYEARDTSQPAVDAKADLLLASDDDPAFQGVGSSAARPLGSAVASSTRQATSSTTPPTTGGDADSEIPEGGNLLINGGFEGSAVGRSGFATAPGWASRERQVEILVDGNLGIPAEEGDQYIELNGRSAGRISQDIAVTAGVTYRWSFAHRARNDQDTVTATIDGEVVTDATSLPGQWRTASGLFIAGPADDTVTFAIEAIDEGEFGNFIDNVRFEVQPGL